MAPTKEYLQFGNINDSMSQPNGLRRWLSWKDRSVTFINELGNAKPLVSGLGVLLQPPASNPPDSAILYRGFKRSQLSPDWKQLSSFIVRPHSQMPLLWRDRWLLRVRRPNRRVDYVMHLNAASQNEGVWLDNAGGRANRESMQKVYEMLSQDMKDGKAVRVALDANINNKRPDAPWTPAWVFKKLGLEYINTDVCYLAWDPKYDEVLHQEKDPRGVPGSDGHGSLRVVLQRKPKWQRWWKQTTKKS